MRTLAHYGVALDDIDRVVVDGWMDARAPIGHNGTSAQMPVAHYHEKPEHMLGLAPLELEGLPLNGREVAYGSYLHSTGHAMGTYATSPWAAAGEAALTLVWDGGMLPRLYVMRPDVPELAFVRPLFGFVGNVYPVFGSYFGPFVPGGGTPTHDTLPDATLLDLSGKVMAWAGLGNVDEDLTKLFDEVYAEKLSLRWDFLFDFTRAVYERLPRPGTRDEDVIASFQAWIGSRLVDALARVVHRDPSLPRRLCFTGGCALNIAWNARLRACGLFEDVWVPPFPNDAGSALGAAAADLIRAGEGPAVTWDAYSGPHLTPSDPAPGWSPRPMAIAQLARFLHASGEPVVFLNGRAEIGPRALGNRSILCSATRRETKELINELKLREWYRPVAPICLEDDAPEVFDPGTPDPYMLFTHHVREPWRKRVPAIMHIDGTARLQTVNETQNPVVAQLLREHRDYSGIPLLCNTSANLKGAGFFPDMCSAMDWPGARHVWCDGVLYSRQS